MKCNKWIWVAIWLSINRLQWQQFKCVAIASRFFFSKMEKHPFWYFWNEKQKRKQLLEQETGSIHILTMDWKKKMKVIREQFKNSIIFQVWHDSIFVSLFETKIHIDSMRELISALNDKYFNFLLLTSSYMLKNTWRLKSMGIVA